MKNRVHHHNALKILCATVGMALTILSALAQSVPPLINYQGKLTDQTGVPLPTGVYVIQFRLWGDATSTNASYLIWDQQQNVTIQSNGVFNVILGSSGGTTISGTTPAVNNLAYAFASSSCFLGVTVAVSNGIPISTPEIVPRQQLLSVPFAFTAAVSSNATLAASVAPGSITTASLAINAVEPNNIAPGAIQTGSIAAGAVTLTNLAPRSVGASVGIGGLAISGSSGVFTTSSSSFVNVTNLTVTITTTGRPVFVTLVPDGSTSDSYLGAGNIATAYTTQAFFQILRDGSAVAAARLYSSSGSSSPSPHISVPCGALHALDFPPAGQHTYTVSVSVSVSTDPNIGYTKLVAFEL